MEGKQPLIILPYVNLERKVHFANLFSEKGASAICFRNPRPINMKTETFTISKDAVTCEKCLKKLKDTYGR